MSRKVLHNKGLHSFTNALNIYSFIEQASGKKLFFTGQKRKDPKTLFISLDFTSLNSIHTLKKTQDNY